MSPSLYLLLADAWLGADLGGVMDSYANLSSAISRPRPVRIRSETVPPRRSGGTLIFWAVGVPAALDGLHRLALRLEDAAHLHDLHKRPRGGAAGIFVALQRAIEPQARHVEQVSREYHLAEEDEAGGLGEGEPAG